MHFLGPPRVTAGRPGLLGRALRSAPHAADCGMRDHPNTDGMISISLKGTTRRPVIVIGPWALKFARGERGRRCNLHEAKLFRNSSEWRRAMLCQVRLALAKASCW
jgi:hypothetical protein